MEAGQRNVLVTVPVLVPAVEASAGTYYHYRRDPSEVRVEAATAVVADADDDCTSLVALVWLMLMLTLTRRCMLAVVAPLW